MDAGTEPRRRSNRPVAKFLSDGEQIGLVDALGAAPGDLLLVCAGTRRLVDHVLGTLRVELGRPPVHDGGLHFLWVVDFPLFEGLDDQGRPDPRAPSVHDAPSRRPGDPRARQGRGSPRGALARLRPRAQRLGARVGQRAYPSPRRPASGSSALLGISDDDAQARFGFLLDAFRYGAPPHAGFAFGIDRLVAILAGEDNIREVIAFPKTQSGADPLTDAPTAIDDAQLAELGLRIAPR